jgi:deoxyribonuclease V
MDWPLAHPHRWDVSPAEAVAIQRDLAVKVAQKPLLPWPRTVAGIDVSYRGDVAQAAVVVLDLETLETVDEAVFVGTPAFPYVPGLLSFREMPAVLPALERLRVRPDVLIFDSQGRAHPRRLGLASHAGVVLDVPSVGIAKSLLVGRFSDLGAARGSTAPLIHRREPVGVALRTREGVHPVFVSVGHRVTLDDAVVLALATATRYKIPEPTRRAHLLTRKAV